MSFLMLIIFRRKWYKSHLYCYSISSISNNGVGFDEDIQCFIMWVYIIGVVIEYNVKLTITASIESSCHSFRMSIWLEWVTIESFSYISILVKERLSHCRIGIDGFLINWLQSYPYLQCTVSICVIKNIR